MSACLGLRVECPSQGLSRIVFESVHEVVHHLANHLPCRFERLARNGGAKRDQIGDKVDVCFQSRKKLRLKHQSL